MYSILNEISAYLIRPSLKAGAVPNAAPESRENAVYIVLRLTMLTIIAGALAGFISQLLIQQKLIPHPGPAVLNLKTVSPLYFFIGAVFLAPVTEELIFRAQLKRFSASLLFVAFALGMVFSVITKTKWAFLISPFIFGLFFLIYRFNLGASVTRKFVYWNKIFPWHFYFTALCFAFLHLANFEKGISLLPLGIFYTLPQLIIGLILGYTRMRYGLKYAIILHSFYNLCFVSLLI